MNGTELLHFSWSLCIGAEVAVQTAAGGWILQLLQMNPVQAQSQLSHLEKGQDGNIN